MLPLPLQVLQRESLASHPDADAVLLARLRQEADRPFSLDSGPLFRFHLWQLGPERHVLLLVFHHLLVDLLSLDILLRELGQAYDSLRQGQQPSLPPPALDFSDVAAWQRSPPVQALEQRQLAFWREHLAEAPRLLQLPTDRPRPPVLSDKGGSAARHRLSPALTQALGALCQEHQVTPFMALYAAFATLLHRYSGQDDVCVGTPVASRPHPSTEDVVGLFVNTVVLRSRVEPSASFASLLAQVRASSLAAFAHQDVPFEKVVSHLGVERSPAHAPLFQVAFTWNRIDAAHEALPGLTASPVYLPVTATKVDLALLVREDSAGYEVEAEYNADLFDASTVQRMLGHYLQLLDHALRAPTTRVDSLSLLSAAERERVLRTFNATWRPFDTHATTVSLFEAQAARAPEATALVARDGTLTYGELRRPGHRARPAPGLARGGSGDRHRRVPGALPGADRVVAGHPQGGRGLPAPGSHPSPHAPHRAAAAAGARLVVARPESFPEPLPHLTRVDPEAQASGTPLRPAHPEHLALVLFTSGTTGEPKAVEVTHRNLVHLFEAADTSYPTRAGDTVLAATSVLFDVHAVELLYPLARGAKVILRETGPLGMGRDILQHRATHLLATPSVITTALEEPEASEALQGLTLLQLGGESPPESLLQRLSGGRVRLLNGYGPSETTCITTLAPLQPGTPIRLGGPLDRVRLYVLDTLGQPVAPGVPGELHIGGEGVSRGYRGHAELTAERFIPDAFSGEPGARLYRTGDRVRWNPDGTLSFLGRTDLQVKVRGMRIELEEIEATLLRQTGVRQAVVLARQRERDTRLESFIVLEGPRPRAEESLREALAAVLPGAMVPSRITVLDALPLTPTGKVDRKALAALPVADAVVKPAGEPPRGAAEGAGGGAVPAAARRRAGGA